MSQQPTDDFNINPATDSGIELAGILNRFNEVLTSLRSGPTAPQDIALGTLWLDTSETPDANVQKIMIYDGAQSLEIAQINISTHKIELSNTSFEANGGTVAGDLIINNGTTISPDIKIGDYPAGKSINLQVDSGHFKFSGHDGASGILLLDLDIINDKFTFQTAVACSSPPSNDEDLTRKDYVDDADDLKLDKTGGTLTGSLLVQDGTNTYVLAQVEDEEGTGLLGVVDHAGHNRATLTFSDSTGDVLLRRYDDAGATESYLHLQDDGNVSVNGSAPSIDSNLTRKDYVDGKFSAGVSGTFSNPTSITVVDGLITAIS